MAIDIKSTSMTTMPDARTAGSSAAKAQTAGDAVAKSVTQGGSTQQQASTQPTVSSEELSKAVEEMNSYVQNTRRNLEFSIDDSTEKTVVKVIDADTEEVIRQIPSEEMLALARHFRDMGESGSGGSLLQTRV